jgi:hypothetical protein
MTLHHKGLYEGCAYLPKTLPSGPDDPGNRTFQCKTGHS